MASWGPQLTAFVTSALILSSSGSHLRQREGGRPHGAFVEVRLIAEAERRVPRLELVHALEEADDLRATFRAGRPGLPRD